MEYYKEANRFSKKYGMDAFKIIAAYEDAADIPQNERYAGWYGDYGIFEPSLNEDMTYDKLITRYNAGLKYLGIIHEQAKAVCSQFLSDQLAEHIREQLSNHNADAEYRPVSVITKMDTPEFTKETLEVDRDMEVNCDICSEITVVFRCWFDADKKFALHINDMDDVWLNMYGKYDPYADTLRIECEIDKPGGCVYFDYIPTDAESQLIKDMITQKIREEYCQTPQEFCEESRNIENGGITQ